MCALSQAEVKKLDLMFEGDSARDASSGIRGFLFQDYVAIQNLLDPEVDYVCSEYLEDVDVFYKDGRFKFIIYLRILLTAYRHYENADR